MQLIYVDMQLSHVDIQEKYFDMQLLHVDMRDKYVVMELNQCQKATFKHK